MNFAELANKTMTGQKPLCRAERRRLMKENKGLTKEQAKQIRAATITKEDYFHYYDLAIADALYCELNLENTKIKEIFDKIKETIKCLEEGYISCFDLETMVEEEIGIRFRR